MKGLHGIIFCYRQRAELRELVAERSSSSIPFASRYRAIDFALSNLINAGCSDVGVLLHGRYQSLLDHLGSGKDWDLSRKHGGLRLLPPFGYEGPGGMQPFRGKMEALANVRSYIDAIRQDYVALMDGDMGLARFLNESKTMVKDRVFTYQQPKPAVPAVKTEEKKEEKKPEPAKESKEEDAPPKFMTTVIKRKGKRRATAVSAPYNASFADYDDDDDPYGPFGWRDSWR